MLNPVICKHNDTDPGLSGIKATLRYMFMLFCSTVLDCLDLGPVCNSQLGISLRQNPAVWTKFRPH